MRGGGGSAIEMPAAIAEMLLLTKGAWLPPRWCCCSCCCLTVALMGVPLAKRPCTLAGTGATGAQPVLLLSCDAALAIGTDTCAERGRMASALPLGSAADLDGGTPVPGCSTGA